jgi:hypothetical protein
MEMEGTTHMIFHCPHAVNLWKAMREVWSIPPYEYLQCPQDNWLEEFLLTLPKDTCDKVLMIIWRIWFVRNEITHEKPMPSIEGSRRFLCSFMVSLTNCRQLTTEIIKGKQLAQPLNTIVTSSMQSTKSWVRPPDRHVKLNVDVSYGHQDGSGNYSTQA